MPELSEILGAIVAGVTQARRIADEEAINVARHYQQEPLLKGLSIPRVRLPDVVIELPIIVQSYEPAQPAQLVDPDVIRESTLRFLIEQLTKQKPLPSNFEGSLNGVLNEAFKAIANLSVLDTNAFAEAAKRALQNALAATDTAIDLKVTGNLIQALRAHLAQTAILKPAVPARMLVQVETEQVKNQSNPQTVTRLRLSLREEGLEWNEIPTESGSTSRLTPE